LIKESDNIYEPNAYDWRKMLESINSLKSGKSIQIHPFDKIKEEVE
jgi:uridine kinase